MIDRERLLGTFLDFVAIDSPSGDEEAFAIELTRRLESLGCLVRRDAFGNLIGRIDGLGPPFLLGAHMDTVEPGRGIRPIVAGELIRTDGTTVLGGDPKSGVAAIIEGITAMRREGENMPSLEIVFTRGEESGLQGSAHLDYSLISARRGVEFDGEGPVRKVTTEAPGRLSIQAEFTGRGAHAGVEPEKGLSAVLMAARFVQGFPQGRIDDETTANIGLISGGSAANAVPERASITAEARSRDKAKLQEMGVRMMELVESVRGEFPYGKVELQMREEFSAYKLDPSHEVVRIVSAALADAGMQAELIASGGATDANNYARHGIDVCVVGLGGADFHTVRESITIPALVEAADFCLALLRRLARG